MSKKTSPRNRPRRRVTSLDDVRIFQVKAARDGIGRTVVPWVPPVWHLTPIITFGKTWHAAREVAMVELGLGPGEIALIPVRRAEDMIVPPGLKHVGFVWRDKAGENHTKRTHNMPLKKTSWPRIEQVIRAAKREGAA